MNTSWEDTQRERELEAWWIRWCCLACDTTYLVLGSGEALADEFALESDSLLHAEAIIVLRQARLPLLVHHQYKLNHGSNVLHKDIVCYNSESAFIIYYRCSRQIAFVFVSAWSRKLINLNLNRPSLSAFCHNLHLVLASIKSVIQSDRKGLSHYYLFSILTNYLKCLKIISK